MKLFILLLTFLSLVGPYSIASESLHYTGRLVNSDGSPVTVSPANIQMDLLSGTTLVCRLNLSTPLQNGVFNVELPFDTSSCFNNSFSSVIANSINQDLYIQVTHGSVTYPKQLISTPPIAIYAKKVPNGSLLQTNFSGITANCPVGQVFLSNGSGGFSCGTVASSAAPTGAAGGDLTGSYPNPQINNDAVLTSHIIDSAVTTNKIANGAVTGVKIAQMAALTGQVLKWNGTTWVPSGDAGLTSESDPTVQGYAKNAPAVCLNNETLRFDALLNSGAGGLFCAPFSTDDIPEGASKQFFTIARARAATVADAITDAVVDVAPSQNAVFDALALKADKNNSTTDMSLNSVTVQNSVKFKEQPVNGINYVGLKAPANVTADMVWTLPAADGSPNMALFTDGAGNLSWAAVSSSMASGSVTADKLDQMGATTGEVLKWNGSQWDPATDEGILYENDPTVMGFSKYNPPICPNDKHLRFDSILNSGSGGLYCAQNQFVDVAGGMNYPSGKIGLGVALPQSKLDVASSLSASSGTEFGTRILPTINQTGTAGYTSLLVNTIETTFGTGTRRLLDLQVGGVTKFSVDNNGNVISTSSTTGTTAEYTSTTGPQLTVGSSSTEKMTASVSSTGFSTFNSIGTTPGYNFTGGNVGIGSAAPGEALDVTGNIRASGSVKTPVLSNIVDLTLTADSDSNATGALIFNTGINERMRVLNNGNVGIGTTAPGNKLAVSGSSSSVAVFVDNTNTAGYGVLRINSGNADAAAGAAIHHFGSTYVSAGGSRLPDQTAITSWGANGIALSAENAGGIIKFLTGGPADSNERMRINSSGNVGIGNNNPAALLNIAPGLPTTAANGLMFGTDVAANLYRSGTSTIKTDGNLTVAGNLSVNGSSLNFAGVSPDRIVATDASKNFVSSLSSANLHASITDPTGTPGNLVFSTSPQLTTSLTTNSASFDLLNSTASTINFGGGASTINVGGASAVMNFSNIAGTKQIQTGGTTNLALMPGGNVGIGTTGPSTKLHVAGSATIDSEVRFLENPINGTNYVGLKSPANLLANVVWTLPVSDGTAGLTLITDGAGNLSWAQASSAGIADNSVTSAKIVDGTIVAADIGTGAIDSSKILDATIVAADIATGAVDSSKILDSTIVTADLANSSVTGVKIAAQSILDSHMSGISSSCSVGQLLKTNGLGSFYCANDIDSNSNKWLDGTGGIYYAAGNVGIGTSAPNEALSVTKAMASWQSRFNNSSGTGSDVYLAHGGGYGMHIRGWNANDSVYTIEMYNNTSLTNAFYNSGRVALGMAGNVGIGTNSAPYKLEVAGDIRANGGWLRTTGAIGWYSDTFGVGMQPTAANRINMYSPNTYLGNVADPVSAQDASTKAYTDLKAGSGFTGSGSTNYIPKFTGATSLGNSTISDDGTTVNIAAQVNVTGGAGTSYTSAPIEVVTTATPRIAFHWPGVVASQLGMDSSGWIRTFNNPGTGYENFAAASITANGTITGTGNISLTAANPTITSGGSYITIPNGAYFSGGTVYVTNPIQARGGIANDSGTTLMLNGGTSSVTQVNGTLNVTGTVTAAGFSGPLTGNASSASSVPWTGVTGKPGLAWSGISNGFVSEMLSWKNYGNSHVIFDASAGTSPSGAAISNTNSAIAWTASYPTLMGWNGTSTYGVRVDSARVADYAAYTTGAQAAYLVTPGDGNGLKFWSSDSYKISMGVGGLYQYGPVTDYSIKMQMDAGSPGRGFTWGREGVAPVAGLNATSGNMQVAGSFSSASVATGGTITSGTEVYNNGWYRSNAASTGWYSQAHGGGIYMTEATTVQVYGGKNFSAPGASILATSFLYTSDARLKKKVLKIENPLDKILALRGVEFTWKKDGKQDLGFIAQEVEKVEPRLVSKDSKGIMSVKYGNVVAIVVEAVKELKELISDNEEETKKLKRDIASVKSENELLKKHLIEQEARINRLEKAGAQTKQ